MLIVQSRYISRLAELEKKPYHTEKPEVFYDSILQNEIESVKDFHKFWINISIPFHIIRYEDIMTDFVNTAKKLFEFLFNTENIKETVIESKVLTFFKFNKNLQGLKDDLENQYKNLFNCFTLAQKNLLIKNLKNELVLFGYINEGDLEKTLKEKKVLDDKDIYRLISFYNFHLSAQNPTNFLVKSNDFQLKNAIRVFEEKLKNEEDSMPGNNLKNQFNFNFMRLE